MYNIELDEKIPVERRKDWERFNQKYPPGKKMVMGRMVDHDYKYQPEQAAGRKWWHVLKDNRDDFKYPPIVPVKPVAKVKEVLDDCGLLEPWEPAVQVNREYKFYPPGIKYDPKSEIREPYKMTIQEVADQLRCSKRTIKGDKIQAEEGSISVEDGSIVVEAGRSKRHLVALEKKLGFMDRVDDNDTPGKWKLNRAPTPEEASTIRGVLELKKTPPPLTEDQKKARKEVAIQNLAKRDRPSPSSLNQPAI